MEQPAGENQTTLEEDLKSTISACTEPERWKNEPDFDAPSDVIQDYFEHARSCPHHAALIAKEEKEFYGIIENQLATVVEGEELWPPDVFEPATIIDLLRWRGLNQPEKVAYVVLRDGVEESSITYGELDIRARAVAAHLQQRNLAGQRALLLYPTGIDFIVGFFGCLYANVIAVPVNPFYIGDSLKLSGRIAAESQAAVALTTAKLYVTKEHEISKNLDFANVDIVATDNIPTEKSSEWLPIDITQDSIALLRCTSGSTGRPRLVILTHRNLLSNQKQIQEAYETDENSIFVGWLPLHHGMGLIGNILQVLYVGCKCYLMPPKSFVRKPIRWLQAISKYKATVSGGTNFAFEHCVRNISLEECSDLDLRSWNVAFIGAEPIDFSTIKRFTEKFTRLGFREDYFIPSYGLAEATLFVTAKKKFKSIRVEKLKGSSFWKHKEDEDSLSRDLVGCGTSFLEQEIIIVDPDTYLPLPDGEEGEIWVSGPNVAIGYWNRDKSENEQFFRAKLANGDEKHWLRTGDLGIHKDEQLFVTGSLRELVTIKGWNYYPEDIEKTVSHSHKALKVDACSAISIKHNSRNKLIVVAETKRLHRSSINIKEVKRAIRDAIKKRHRLPVDVILVEPESIPRYALGKVQRRLCRLGYVEKSLEEITEANVVEKSSFSTNLYSDYLTHSDSKEKVVELRSVNHVVTKILGIIAEHQEVPVGDVDPSWSLDCMGFVWEEIIELSSKIEVLTNINISDIENLAFYSIYELAQKIVAST